MQVTDEMVRVACAAYRDNAKDGNSPTLNDMRAALTAALAAMWRPIEEAPKDGTPVLMMDQTAPSIEPTISRYWGHRWETSDWDERSYMSARWMTPTHFMPLPTPPKRDNP